MPVLPRMTCNPKSGHLLHFVPDTNVTTLFRHHLFPLTRPQSLVHSIQLDNTHLQESKPSLFLIVHHKGSFRPMQHKVVCRLLLTVVCRSPFLISCWQGRPVGSLDLRTLTQFSKSLPSFVQHLFLVGTIQGTHVAPAAVVRGLLVVSFPFLYGFQNW